MGVGFGHDLGTDRAVGGPALVVQVVLTAGKGVHGRADGGYRGAVVTGLGGLGFHFYSGRE